MDLRQGNGIIILVNLRVINFCLPKVVPGVTTKGVSYYLNHLWWTNLHHLFLSLTSGLNLKVDMEERWRDNRPVVSFHLVVSFPITPKETQVVPLHTIVRRLFDQLLYYLWSLLQWWYKIISLPWHGREFYLKV